MLGRIVTTAGTSPSLDPGISAYLEAVRDYLVVSRHQRQRAGALGGGARAQRRRARSGSPRRSTPSGCPSAPARSTSAPAAGACATSPCGSRPRGPRSAGCWWRRRPARSRSARRELLRSMLLIAPVILLAAALVGYWLAGTFAPAGAGHHGRGRGDLRRHQPAPAARGADVGRRDGAARAHGERHARPAGAELRQPAPVHRRREPRAQDAAHGAPGRRGARAGASGRARRDPPVAGRDAGADQRDDRAGGEPADAGPGGRGPGAAGGRGVATCATCWATWRRPPACWARASGVSVTSTMPEHPVRLAVDRHRIREMLLNLVTNAIKYTPAGRDDRPLAWPSRTAR